MYFALALKDRYIPSHVDNCFQIILLLRRASELMKSSSSNRTCRKLVMDGGFETRSYFYCFAPCTPHGTGPLPDPLCPHTEEWGAQISG